MPLVSMRQMLQDARDKNYAIGYFESWNLESLDAVIESAEELRSPIIIGFGGGALEQNWLNTIGLRVLASMGVTVAQEATVPVALILNEVINFEQIVQGIKYGFNVVMMDNSHLSFEENVERTRKIVKLAHPAGVGVEAELGQLPTGVKDKSRQEDASLTDPMEAARFVMETGVDALAISCGNVHVLIEDKATIDLDRLERIHKLVDIPLVIHGGTGFPDEDVGEVIKLGVAKFNVGTILKQSFIEGMKERMDRPGGISEYIVLGSREKEDILSSGRLKMKETIKGLLKTYRSIGKADL